MKKHWYSIKRIVVPATDLCLTEIPERLARCKARYADDRRKQRSKYQSFVETIIYTKQGDIINYLYKELNKIPFSTLNRVMNVKIPVIREQTLPNKSYDPYGTMGKIIGTIRNSRVYIKLSDSVTLSYVPS